MHAVYARCIRRLIHVAPGAEPLLVLGHLALMSSSMTCPRYVCPHRIQLGAGALTVTAVTPTPLTPLSRCSQYHHHAAVTEAACSHTGALSFFDTALSRAVCGLKYRVEGPQPGDRPCLTSAAT